jgi:hypothetical protein
MAAGAAATVLFIEPKCHGKSCACAANDANIKHKPDTHRREKRAWVNTGN